MKKNSRTSFTLLFALILSLVAIIPDAALAKSLLATPILVSPTNGTKFQDFPRATTLVWKPVAHATGYQVDWQYYQNANTWASATPVILTGNLASSYTFDFIGDQPGRWQVIALDSTATYLSSEASAWRTFDYNTLLTLPTPVQVSPPKDAQFYHFPRATTLAWDQVQGATGYVVEWQFFSAGEWSTSASIPIDGLQNTSYTFNFIGEQPGRWRVTATGTSGQVNDSAPSEWFEFMYHE